MSRPASLTADLFTDLVRDLQRGPTVPLTVKGGVALSCDTFTNPLVFRDITFQGTFDASGSTFSSIMFVGCRFQRSLDLSGCHCTGDLVLANCIFQENEAGKEEVRLHLEGVHVEGSLRFDGKLEVHGAVCVDQAIVDGDVRAAELDIRGINDPSRRVALSLNGSCIGGSLLFGSEGQGVSQAFKTSDITSKLAGTLTCERVIVKGKFHIAHVQVAGHLSLDHSEIGGLFLLEDIQFSKHDERADSYEIYGLSATCLKCEGAATFDRIYECNKFTLYGSKFSYMLRIYNVGWRIDAPGRRRTCVLDLGGIEVDVQLQLEAIRGVDVVKIFLSKIGSLFAGTMSQISLGSLIIGQTEFGAATILRVVALDTERADHLDAGISVSHCKFGDSLLFWTLSMGNSEPGHPNRGWLESDRVVCHGGLTVTNCAIDGPLDLSRVRVGYDSHDKSVGDGRILLEGTKAGEIRFASALSVADRSALTDPARRQVDACIAKTYGAIGEPAWPRSFDRVICNGLLMNRVVATNVDLSGLELRVRDSAAGPDGDGFVRAYGIKVKEHFSIVKGRNTHLAAAIIPRALRLSGAEIGLLKLGTDSFEPGTDGPPPNIEPTAWTIGIVLDRATIDTLQVPRNANGAGSDDFPRPLDLGGLRVNHWRFSTAREVRPTPDDFLDFLDNDQRLHRELYRTISARFRNSGDDKDAEKIQFAEDYRSHWEPKGLWRRGDGRLAFWLGILPKGEKGRIKIPLKRWPWRIGDSIARRLFQYYRNPKPLAAIIVMLMVVSLPIALQPGNFELADTARQIVAQSGEVPIRRPDGSWQGQGMAAGISAQQNGRALGPRREEWGLAEAGWMVLRYHIPIISLAARSDYVATEDNHLRLAYDRESSFLTADDWFTAMSILNWLMWPLLLTFLLRRLLRDR